MRILEILQLTAENQNIKISGWVRTKRGSKHVSFIALNDGSTIHNIQIVAEGENFDEELLKGITTGTSIQVEGELVESKGSGQAVEILASKILVTVLSS